MARSQAIERSLAEYVRAEGPRLCESLARLFPSLRDDVDDLFQTALQQTLKKIRDEGFCPKHGWGPWLIKVASNRARDLLRDWERRTFVRISQDPTASMAPVSQVPRDRRGDGPGPQTGLLEVERRNQQALLLSDVFREFTRYCEERTERLCMKEAYERSLRGQRPAEIATAFGVDRDLVDVWLKRARDWVLKRVRRSDVEKSVFRTLHRMKGK